MPRQARLDAPGVLHHVMARGIERRRIFLDDRDREDFLRRLSELATSTALEVYAWSLMPNHFHLLVRTVKLSLSQNMRSLMSGYAGYFNRRHRRHGYVSPKYLLLPNAGAQALERASGFPPILQRLIKPSPLVFQKQ